MSTSIARAPVIATWSWMGRNDGSVERASSPASRRARVAMYSPSIPPFVRIMSASSRPKYSLLETGAEVVLAGHEKRTYASKHSYPCEVDATVASLNPKEFDAVIIPGGVAGPDRLRQHKDVLDFVRTMDRDGKIVAAICHAAWVPVSAGIVKGRRMTSYASVKDDCINAGASWVDKECVVDGTFITSRYPDDLPAFCRAIVSSLSK